MNILTLLVSVLLAVQSPIAAQVQQTSPAVQSALMPTALPSVQPDQTSQLGPGDIVDVTVWTGNEVLEQRLTVAADGTLFVPFFVNKLVPVSGLTSIQLRLLLDQELRKNYLNPVVQVIQNTIQSKKALLVTDVGLRTGYYPITGETTALDFIMANGGYAVGANLVEVQITRANGERVRANLFDALMGTDKSGNVKLLPNDTVYVPSLQTVSTKIFLIAEGRSVQVLQVQDRITLLEALGRSGAAVTNSRLSELAVIRYNLAKKETDVHTIKFDEIYAKRANLSVNVMLENGDIVYLPKTRLARTAEILGALSPMLSFVNQAIFLHTALQQ